MQWPEAARPLPRPTLGPSRRPAAGPGTPTAHAVAGLCASCVLAPDCTFPREAGVPIRHCDEFDGGSPRPSVRRSRVASPAPVLGEERLKGLCVNCAEAPTCRYPRPEGGVWHCEEYR